MARERWWNGNQVGYGSGGWYRFVIDRDISGDTISVWWGVESNLSLSDGTNSGDTNVNGSASVFNNVSISHGSGGGVTWLRGEPFNVGPQQSITVSGFVQGLAEFAGGGGQSSVTVSWTNPRVAAGPPNQMATPVVNNITATTHQVHFTAPATNGAAITNYVMEWHYGSGGLAAAVTTTSSPVNGLGFSPNVIYAVRVAANSSAGASPWSPWSWFQQAVASPIAPSMTTVVRNSDTSHSLSWTRADQSAGPYNSQEVLRATCVSGVWGPYTVIAALSGSATSYVDTTTVANRVYRYQIRASNATGNSTSDASAFVWTTPAPPTGQTATKDAASNIVVSWTPPSGGSGPNELKYEVSESTDNGTSWTVRTTTAAGATTWTHTAPSAALPHTYRVRAIVSPTGYVGSGLASAYAVTNTVQLLTPPAAPTNLQNNPAGTVDRAQPITLTWTHNPLDSSPQTKYTLQHRALGSGTWTTTVGPITSAVSSYTLAANAYPTGTAFEWRVLTYGLHATGGPYSAIATVQISSIPGVSISSPTVNQVLGTTSLTVTWAFSDPDSDPQGSWEATLIGSNGVAIEARTGADTANSTTFEHRLQEGAYSVRVRVRDSRGLWSNADTRNFTVSYPLPPVPVITWAEWDWKHGTIELELSVPAPTGGQVAPEYLEVWRSIDDGPLRLLVANLPPATLSYLDFTPTVDGKNTYVIQAVSALPSASQSSPTATHAVVTTPRVGDGRPAVWLSAGQDFTTVGRLASEVQVDAGRIRERVLHRYAGRPLPVEHSGEHVDETWQVGGTLNLRWSQDVDDPESPEDWLALGALAGPFLLRAPALFGTRPLYVFVTVDGPTVSRQKGGNVYQVSFTATRTEEAPIL